MLVSGGADSKLQFHSIGHVDKWLYMKKQVTLAVDLAPAHRT